MELMRKSKVQQRVFRKYLPQHISKTPIPLHTYI